LDLKMVLLLPSLMVPPICSGLCSGISITWGHKRTLDVETGLAQQKTLRRRTRSLWLVCVTESPNTSRTTGCLDSGSNSVELASENGQGAQKTCLDTFNKVYAM
jgi:hypothetical protein